MMRSFICVQRRANRMPSIEQKPECDLNVAEVGLDLPNCAAVHIVEGEIRLQEGVVWDFAASVT